MAATDSFAELMVGLDRGDDAAAAQVFHRFARQMLELARRHLGDRLRRKVDPEDVLQSVFRSFFVCYREGRFHIRNWENLWGILKVMTLRRAAGSWPISRPGAATCAARSACKRRCGPATSRSSLPRSQVPPKRSP
jgi:hypothetical protein